MSISFAQSILVIMSCVEVNFIGWKVIFAIRRVVSVNFAYNWPLLWLENSCGAIAWNTFSRTYNYFFTFQIIASFAVSWMLSSTCRTIYNWWRQRKHKRLTKDEQHLHMAWEEDYHMQDPGRLALFDEYLEMSTPFSKHFRLTLLCKLFMCLFWFSFSSAVWICDIVCGRISTGTVFCIAQ